MIVLTAAVISRERAATAGERLDLAGAMTVTASLMTAVYAIVNGNEVGWLTARTLGLLAASAVLLAIFVAIESALLHRSCHSAFSVVAMSPSRMS